jgi:hypothetical protein
MDGWSGSVGSLKFGNSRRSLLSQSRGLPCDDGLASTFDMRHSTVNCRNKLSQMTERDDAVVRVFLWAHSVVEGQDCHRSTRFIVAVIGRS